MKATNFEFRFRVWIIAALYFLGFYAPWTRIGAVAPDTTAWLALSTILARLRWLPLDQSTIVVTGAAIACAFIGAALRVWGVAYLGATVMQSGDMHAERVLAAGPYRFVRNPLYIGSWFFALSVSVLMPPSGAIFFMLAISVFYLRLILAEEPFLENELGENYVAYRGSVPRLLPRLRPHAADETVGARWLQAAVAEILPAGFAVCFAVLAWRYEPRVLIQALLVCLGLSLVARAVLPRDASSAP